MIENTLNVQIDHKHRRDADVIKATEPASRTHGVMFHHFYNEKHSAGQGSISSEQFSSMLDWLEDRYSILSPAEYPRKLVAGTLSGTDICLAFDDALLCQSGIAAPIMKKETCRPSFSFTHHRLLEALTFSKSTATSEIPNTAVWKALQ